MIAARYVYPLLRPFVKSLVRRWWPYLVISGAVEVASEVHFEVVGFNLTVIAACFAIGLVMGVPYRRAFSKVESTPHGYAHVDDGTPCTEPAWCERGLVWTPPERAR